MTECDSVNRKIAPATEPANDTASERAEFRLRERNRVLMTREGDTTPAHLEGRETELNPDEIGTAGVFAPHPLGQDSDVATARIFDARYDLIGHLASGIAISASAGRVFFECTGKHPQEAAGAFRLFCEALMAAVVPGHEEWVRECISRLDSTSGDQKRAAVLSLLRRQTSTRKNMIATMGALGLECPASWCPDLLFLGPAGQVDERFRTLGDGTVSAVQKAHRSVYAQAARLSLMCGAFGEKRGEAETEQKALNRIAAAFRAAEDRLSAGHTQIKPTDV